jgi:tetratricopeptide (TPR) repeat protein
MSKRYDAFQIHVLEKTEGVYPLVARGSDDATFHGTIPAEQLANLDADHWLEQSQSDEFYERELGSQLFHTLFPQDVLVGFRSSLAVAKAQGMGLRLVLTLEPPELARLPWELIYAERFEGFLARRAATPIVRHLSSTIRARKPIQGDALRVLMVVAEPEDLPTLSASHQETRDIARALSHGRVRVDVEEPSERSKIAGVLQHVGSAVWERVVGPERVRVHLVEHITRSKLKNALREAENAGRGYHLVHFIGHGASDEMGGRLIFEDTDGFPDPVPAEQVAELLDDTSVNMVFLNACASAREGEPGRLFYPFSGVAQACVNLGIRAALAMQVEILDSAAANFAREFYASLADGEEVEKAILDARQLVGKADAADWAVPVLYSRAPEGSILAPEITRPPRSLWDWVQEIWKCITKHPLVVVLGGLLSALALVLGLFVDIQESRQPGGLLHPLWPAPTATPTPLPPMSDGFNVAVAQFAALDATGQLTVTQESRDLSDWLYRSISAERDRLPPALAFGLRGPDEVEAVFGTDRDARAADAQQLARRHNASILIYGLVTAGDDGHRVEPEFYVSDASFDYGSEVAGPDRLGKAVPFEPPLDNPQKAAINESLFARNQVLQHVVAGLAYYYLERYEVAWARFRQAALVPGWQAEEGKEVVYLLMGAAQLDLYESQVDCKEVVYPLMGAAQLDLDESHVAGVGHLSHALDAFAEAHRLNPGYARSYLGLGSVALRQAVRDEEEGLDQEKLIEARGWYSASLSVPDQPALAYVSTKAYFGLGQVYLKGYEHRLPGWSPSQARRYLERVVTAYEEKRAPDLIWFAGRAHALLGRLAGDAEDWAEMSSACREAIELLNSLPGSSQQITIARYWTWVAFAEEKDGHLEEARDAFWQAIQVGRDLVCPEELATWQKCLSLLEKGVPCHDP